MRATGPRSAVRARLDRPPPGNGGRRNVNGFRWSRFEDAGACRQGRGAGLEGGVTVGRAGLWPRDPASGASRPGAASGGASTRPSPGAPDPETRRGRGPRHAAGLSGSSGKVAPSRCQELRTAPYDGMRPGIPPWRPPGWGGRHDVGDTFSRAPPRGRDTPQGEHGGAGRFQRARPLGDEPPGDPSMRRASADLAIDEGALKADSRGRGLKAETRCVFTMVVLPHRGEHFRSSRKNTEMMKMTS